MRGVRKHFGPTVALAGVDFSVAPGEIHALCGENGAGKSTLMKVLSGAIRPDEGELLLDARPFRPRNPLDARREGVMMVYQELSLAPHLTVEENILLGVEPAWLGLLRRRELRRRAAEALELLEHPEIRPNSRVLELPLPAQQLVEIARALALSSRVLVLDEPTSSLGRMDVERLFALIRRLRERGLGIVYISHFLEEVLETAGRFTVLRDGRTVGGGSLPGPRIEELVALMAGRRLMDLYPRSPRRPGEVVLEARELSGARLPRRASLELHRGEILGLAGLTGAGRSELLRALYGLEPVRSGRVRLGAYLGSFPPADRLAQGMGFASEDRKGEGLGVGLSVADNLTLPRLAPFGPLGLVFPRRQAAAAEHWVRELSVHCASVRDPVERLSGGNQQKVALARLLHSEVEVLLLDEPTRGIDVASKAQLYRLLDQLACAGKAILLTSSHLPELLGVCDRIAVLCRGRLGAARPVAEWDEQSLLLAAVGGAA
jgi:ribose transport system ATP-binding protein